MGPYILIMMFAMNGNSGKSSFIATQEYTSKVTCEQAKSLFLVSNKLNNSYNLDASAICTQK